MTVVLLLWQVFMWFGPDSTDIEKKLSVKAAQVGVLAAQVGVLYSCSYQL